MNRFAKGVYQALEPRVLEVLKHYVGDFQVHDRRFFEETALPGIEYLVAVRKTGTQVFVLGMEPDSGSNYLATTAERFLAVTAGADARVTELSQTKAQQRLERGAIEVSITAKGPGWWTLSIVEGLNIGTARVNVVHDHRSGGAKAAIEITLQPGLKARSQMLAKLAIERRVTALTGTLFWTVDRLTINGQPDADWLEQLLGHAQVLEPFKEAAVA
jgi:hypothetical protein